MTTTTLCEPGVRERTWTMAEYYRLGELGFFRGQRVELIEGRLMVQSPQNAPHASNAITNPTAISPARALPR